MLTIGRNLLSNAIKYTGKGEIVLSTTYKDGVFMLMVKDTGTGLDDKQQNKSSRNLQDWEMRSPNRDLAWDFPLSRTSFHL